MRTVGRTALILVTLLSAGLSTVACTASDRPSTLTSGASTPAAQPSASPEAQPSAVSPASGPPCSPDDFKVEGALGSKPTITVPSGCKPQDGLVVKDVEPGTGPEIKQGSTASLHYVLATFSDRQTREASWDSGKPFDLENIGQAAVIDGWNEGLIGLKQGGRRLLVVPSDKGYPQGQGSIPPGETLVFVIDAVQVSG
ncbi:FKBP-type peptidyl-prolyl cis-trans isomerase [Umezawaea sp. Da 62-37]|uniref:FKBP-type peptidyl-prolyl cis-trans isomerase n=1 Tax=Umezawaea sp. Da 62-37 TaxID=3075927 RepID=UPI0028F72236|nr:FKBP-type peptidyl-prolyl cis-trans isomerase [Umezawaea sp. Da 62-37]WNV84258.1 FKBP-type peptidyl-prolyl cis-trans isomerase [Umezawaea sp. Da 62-37]